MEPEETYLEITEEVKERLTARLASLMSIYAGKSRVYAGGQQDAVFREVVGFAEAVQLSYGWVVRYEIWDEARTRADVMLSTPSRLVI